MGAPTKTQVETWTDAIAAMIQKDIDGFKSEYTPRTATSIFDMIDGSGDPHVEAALTAAAIAVDRQSFPEYGYNWLQTITSRTYYQGFVNALRALVVSADGGGYSSFRAFLVDKAAKLHALYGELHMSLYSSDFIESSVVKGVSNPNYACIFPDRVYQGADGSLAAETTDAQSSSTADVTLFANDNDALYIGCDRPFQGVVIALSTLSSADITATFKYWNGNAWATLTVTDNTVGLTRNDLINWTVPDDWTRHYKDSGGTAFADTTRLYYIRIDRTANTVVTPPVGTCITLIPTELYTGATATTHIGLPQPPLAVFRISADDTIAGIYPAAIDYTRFAEPVHTESKIRLRALTALANDLTLTLTYVNQDGSNGSTAQTAWTAPAALGTKTVALTSSDGIRSVRSGSTADTNGSTYGVFAVEAIEIRTPAV